jgi:chaperonin GroES
MIAATAARGEPGQPGAAALARRRPGRGTGAEDDPAPETTTEIVATGHAPRRFSMKIRPLEDRVIVRRVKEEEKTKGGLFIPDTAKEKPVEAIVLAVGNGKILEDGTVRPLDVKVGDRVLFGKYTGNEVKIDGEEALILRQDDILGILES